jgi:peptidylprolyl isomerase
VQNSRRIILSLLGVCVLVTGICYVCNQKHVSRTSENTNTENRRVFSKLVGYKIWNEFKDSQDYYLLEDIIEGMKDCQVGKPAPKEIGSEEEQLFSSEIEEAIVESLSQNNLVIAERYLTDISMNPHIVEVEKGKIYHEVLQEGTGDGIALEGVYTFHYTIMTHDSEVIQDTRKDNSPKNVSLSDAMVGFSRGVMGMKCGERRKIYIHPDMAYRKTNWLFPSQSLLIIDVERLPSHQYRDDLPSSVRARTRSSCSKAGSNASSSALVIPIFLPIWRQRATAASTVARSVVARGLSMPK